MTVPRGSAARPWSPLRIGCNSRRPAGSALGRGSRGGEAAGRPAPDRRARAAPGLVVWSGGYVPSWQCSAIIKCTTQEEELVFLSFSFVQQEIPQLLFVLQQRIHCPWNKFPVRTNPSRKNVLLPVKHSMTPNTSSIRHMRSRLTPVMYPTIVAGRSRMVASSRLAHSGLGGNIRSSVVFLLEGLNLSASRAKKCHFLNRPPN